MLFLSESEDENLELSPVADNRFLLVVFPIAYTFDRASDRGPWRLSVQPPGQEKPDVFERVAEFQPTVGQLTAYAGRYVSEEIEPVYRIVVANSSLVLTRLKSKPQKLRPTLADYFESPRFDLHFQRDGAGKVTGFVLDAGRIKNFRFRRAGEMEAGR